MAKESLRYQSFSRRALIIGGLQLLGFSGLAARLYYLSIIKGETYRLRADKNRIALRLIAPVRGEILDRQGHKLATNQQDFRIFLVPEQAGNVEEIFSRLSPLLGLSAAREARLLRQIKRQPKFWPVTVAERLDWDSFARVNVAIPDLPGVQPDAGLSRFYPDGAAVAHIIGYLGDPPKEDVDRNPLFRQPGFKIGREGIEDKYDDFLRGIEGSRRVEVNALGREIRELPPRKEALKGQDLHLSIDLNLQRLAVDLLREEAGGIVAINVETGELLALASTPGFDPNEFTLGMSRENWQAIVSDPRKPLLNKCLAGQFPPGSTIKMLVALAALARGIVSEDTHYYCNGQHKLGNHIFHCHRRQGHGNIDLKGAITHSCDVYFWKMAEQLDVDDIGEMARRFGLGEIHDIALDGQQPGLVPSKAWKERTRREPWQKGDTLNVAIGQGAMLATPLQLAVMTARIATGRRVKPMLVMPDQSVKPYAFEPLDINPLHLAIVQKGMEMVAAAGGTAYDPRRPRTAPKLASKTGTAQVRRITENERQTRVLTNHELPWQSRDHALFVTYGPVENPKVAVSVLVQHGGGGGSTAGPLGRRLIDEALRQITAEAKGRSL